MDRSPTLLAPRHAQRRPRFPVWGATASLLVHACLLLVFGAATIGRGLEGEQDETAVADPPLQIRYVAREPTQVPVAPTPDRTASHRSGEPVERAITVPPSVASFEKARSTPHDQVRDPLPTRGRTLPPLEPPPAPDFPRENPTPEIVGPPPRPPRVEAVSPPPLVPAVRLPVEVPVLETDPVLATTARPRYPESCLRDGHEGTVEFELSIATDGTVDRATLITSSGCRDLDRSARRTALRLRYTPATLGGEPVVGTVRWRVHFRLDEE